MAVSVDHRRIDSGFGYRDACGIRFCFGIKDAITEELDTAFLAYRSDNLERLIFFKRNSISGKNHAILSGHIRHEPFGATEDFKGDISATIFYRIEYGG